LEEDSSVTKGPPVDEASFCVFRKKANGQYPTDWQLKQELPVLQFDVRDQAVPTKYFHSVTFHQGGNDENNETETTGTSKSKTTKKSVAYAGEEAHVSLKIPLSKLVLRRNGKLFLAISQVKDVDDRYMNDNDGTRQVIHGEFTSDMAASHISFGTLAVSAFHAIGFDNKKRILNFVVDDSMAKVRQFSSGQTSGYAGPRNTGAGAPNGNENGLPVDSAMRNNDPGIPTKWEDREYDEDSFWDASSEKEEEGGRHAKKTGTENREHDDGAGGNQEMLLQLGQAEDRSGSSRKRKLERKREGESAAIYGHEHRILASKEGGNAWPWSSSNGLYRNALLNQLPGSSQSTSSGGPLSGGPGSGLFGGPNDPLDTSLYRKHILTGQKNIKYSKKYLMNIFQSPLD